MTEAAHYLAKSGEIQGVMAGQVRVFSSYSMFDSLKPKAVPLIAFN